MSSIFDTVRDPDVPPPERQIVAPGVEEALLAAERGRGGPASPVRLTLVAKTGTGPEERLAAVAERPTWRLSLRAPRVYDLELPATELPRLLAFTCDVLERIETGGRVFGLRVKGDTVVAIRFASREPMTPELGERLQDLGVWSRSVRGSEVCAIARGSALAALALLPSVGPIEVVEGEEAGPANR